MNVTVSVYKREMNQAAQEDPPILGTKTSVVSLCDHIRRAVFDPQWSLPTNCTNKLI